MPGADYYIAQAEGDQSNAQGSTADDSVNRYIAQAEQDSQPQAQAAPPPAQQPEPSFLQKLTGEGSFLHTASDTLSRPGEVTGNLISAAGNAFQGNTGTAGQRLTSAAKAVPGMLAGAVDTVDTPLRWLGLPSLQPTVDQAVGFNDSDRMSTQRLLKEAGALERDDNPLLSVPGLVGFAGDVAKDPLSYVTGGLTKAGEQASKVSGAANELSSIERNAARATELGNNVHAKQLADYKASLPELPTGTPLAPTKSAQVDAGQRALVQFAGQPIVGGKAVYDVADKIGSALGSLSPVKALAHNPITETAAEVGQHMQQGQSEFDNARKAIHLLHETSDATKRATLAKQLEDFYGRWAPAQSPVTPQQFAASAENTFSPTAESSSRFIQNALESKGFTPPEAKEFVAGVKHSFDEWTNIEQKLSGNVGSGMLQITPANKALFHKFDSNTELIGNLTEALNGKLGGGTSINAEGGLRQMIDKAHRAGLSVDELNDLLVSHGITQQPGLLEKLKLRDALPEAPLAKDTGDVLYMRGAQHIRANGVQDYVDGLASKGIARGESNPSFKYAATFDSGPAGERATKLFFRTQEEASLADRTLKLLVDPGQSGKLLQYVDSFNRTMRSGVTRMFPEFHLRNTLSNRLQSWLEDVPLFGEHRTLASDIVAGKPVSMVLGGKTYDRDQILKLFADSGASKGGFYEAALAEAAPLGSRPTKLAPVADFIEHAAAAPAGLITGGLRKDPGMIKNINGQIIEETDRLAHWLAKVKEGYSPAQATKSVDKALFNYAPSALTPFEQETAKRVMLFYGYQRNVLPLIFEKALERPGKIGALTRLGTSGGHPDSTPEYLQDQQTVGLPRNLMEAIKGGPPRQDAVATSIPSPLPAAIDPIAGFDKGLTEGARSLLAKTTPLIKGPLEAILKKDTYTGQDITNRPPEALKQLGQKVPAVETILSKLGMSTQGVSPELNVALKNIPTSRLMQNVDSVAKDGFTHSLLSKLAGVSVNQWDELPQKFYSMQEKIKPQLQEFYNRGWIKMSNGSYSVNKDAIKGSVPERVYRLVALYNDYGAAAHKAKQAADAAKASAVPKP